MSDSADTATGDTAQPPATEQAEPVSLPSAHPDSAAREPAQASESSDPVRLAEVIADLRRDLEQARTDADTRAEQARDAVVHEIGRALGLVADEHTDPEQVIAELTDRATTSDRKLREYRVNDAITAAADAHHGDRKLLLPYLRGAGALDELDTDAPDFTARIDSLVADAITANPKLANSPAVERSGGDFSAGASSPPVPDEEDIESLRRKVRDSIASSRT